LPRILSSGDAWERGKRGKRGKRGSFRRILNV
jgi:hypothetical protein